MDEKDLLSIRQILEQVGKNSGWLYLPKGNWTLETKGVFVPYSKNDKMVPEFVKKIDLNITIDSDIIEDIASNAQDQIGSSDIDKLFEAFLYYCKNDAFTEFG